MDGARLRLLLEIDPMAQPVTGTVSGDPGPAQAFTGWTQLGHAIDVAINAVGERAARPDDVPATGEPR